MIHCYDDDCHFFLKQYQFNEKNPKTKFRKIFSDKDQNKNHMFHIKTINSKHKNKIEINKLYTEIKKEDCQISSLLYLVDAKHDIESLE